MTLASLARIGATGRGRISARLVIEGWPVEYVSDRRMARDLTDGRTRLHGLDVSRVEIGASADMMRATIEADGITARISDMGRIAGARHGAVTRSLLRGPTVRTYLRTTATPTATTIDVYSTEGLPSSGVVHIGTEAIAYTGKTSDTLTGCTRGAWDTIAQAHYVSDGEGLADALVTDYPLGVEGRRAYLYILGDVPASTAQLTSLGTLRWRGVCATDVSWADGVAEIQIDSIARVLAQPIGGDMDGTIAIRGIHYTPACPWELRVYGPSGSLGRSAVVRLAGFYETDRDVCDAANALIDSALSTAGISLGTGASLRMQPMPGGYRLIYVTATTSPVAIYAEILACTPGEYVLPGVPRALPWQDGDGTPLTISGATWTPDAETVYTSDLAVPSARATIGYYDGTRREGASYSVEANRRIYLGGTVVPGEGDMVQLSAGPDDRYRVQSVDLVTRSAVLIEAASVVRLDNTTEITIGRRIAVGTVANLAAEIRDNGPTLANTGAMPLLASGDVTWTTDLETALLSTRITSGRGFYAYDEAPLREYVEPELRAIGAYQGITLTGALRWARWAPALETDDATWEIDDSAIIGVPTVERSSRGVLSHVVYRMGYDPREGEWDERTITYRDVQTTSSVRTPVSLEIAQRSTSTGGADIGDDWGLLDRSEVARLAMLVFGQWGAPYLTITLITDARYMDARIGDVARVSSKLIVAEDGVSPIDATGVITAHKTELGTGRTTLTIIVGTQRIAGYAPEIPISSESLVSGTTWDLTLDLTYAATADARQYYEAGESIRVRETDTTTASSVDGVVVSVSASVVRVELSGAWTPAGEWTLSPSPSATYDAGARMLGYAFIAGTSAEVATNTTPQPAQVFA